MRNTNDVREVTFGRKRKGAEAFLVMLLLGIGRECGRRRKKAGFEKWTKNVAMTP